MFSSSRVRRLFPFLGWPKPTKVLLRGEALAGLTVGLMVIPQGVAYAALAGMPLVTGIYASMMPALVAVLFSRSVRLSVGPTALSCLLVSASLAGMAQPGSAEWVALAVWLSLIAGLLQVILGLVRFGWLLNLVNAPVLMAFTQAAALLIIGSQVPSLLGFRGDLSDFIQTPSINPLSLAFGVISLIALVLARRRSPRFPSVLLVMLLAAGLSLLIGFEGSGGAVVGALPQGLPELYWPDWPGFRELRQLAVPVLVITLISFLETAASARVDNARHGAMWDQNQDLIGQGLAKLASGLSGAFPTSSSFSRSALNLYAGAQTGWATLCSVLVVVVALLLLLPVLHHVPQSVLASIVVVAVTGLMKPSEFVRLWRISRVETVIAVATFAITLLSAPQLYWGVMAGVLMTLSHFLYLRLHPKIYEVDRFHDARFGGRQVTDSGPVINKTYAFRMDAELDFGSANALEQSISNYLSKHPQTQRIIFLASSINRVDSTGVEVFMRLRTQLAIQRRLLVMVGLRQEVEAVLRAADALPLEGVSDPYIVLFANDAQLVDFLAAEQTTA